MSRPERKKSPLASQGHPAQPRDPATPATPAPAPSPVKRPETRTKVGFYVDVEEARRARGAYKHLPRTVTAKSWSDFLAGAVLREVTRLEAEYNSGRPFPDAMAGELPAGRPMGE